jgi:CrcB protein
MARLLWICLGGAVGTGARYLLSIGIFRLTGPGFPYGTLAVNVLGSFLLGLLMHLSATTESFPPTLRLALTTGVMGGFTTYSTFNQETLGFLREDAWGLGFAYLAITVAGCLLAGLLGLLIGRLLTAS